jgi:hypothetical protein
MKEIALWFGTMIVVAALSVFLGAGMEHDHMLKTDVMFAYGCGRHNAMRTAKSDPLEYEGCDNVREMWERSEQWPPTR